MRRTALRFHQVFAAALLIAAPLPVFPAYAPQGGWIGNWAPGIGDPSVVGWVTAAAYLAAGFACLLLARSVPEKGEAIVWGAFSGILFFLGANKQLDLQTGMTEYLRILSRAQGWYGARAFWQLTFIALLALSGAAALVAAFRFTRRHPFPAKLALLGICLIVVFVLVRTSSFHHVDRLLGSRLLNAKMNWILELGGILVVSAGAFGRMRDLRLRSDRSNGLPG